MKPSEELQGEVIGKLGTTISFLVDSYGDAPSMMDDCIYQMIMDLRSNNPDFRKWEDAQKDELKKRRKAKQRKIVDIHRYRTYKRETKTGTAIHLPQYKS